MTSTFSRTSSVSEVGQPLVLAFRRAPLDHKIFSFHIAKLAHPLCKSAAEVFRTEGCGNCAEEKADTPKRARLLRLRRERPRHRRAAEQRDELAPLHVW